MTEISLNILDIAENSVAAGAKNIQIEISVSRSDDILKVIIADDGKGMDQKTLEKVTDPFFTSRTTRKIGLGVPFFKMAAEATGGSFEINSSPGEGTRICADFVLSHIDRMPLGDISTTIHNLIVFHPQLDVSYRYQVDDAYFDLNTKEIREILGDIPLNSKEVSRYIKDYLVENKQETDKEEVFQ